MTQLYSDVVSPPTHGRRVALFSVARLQSAGAGSGLETKRSALGAHLSVDTYSQTTAAVSHIVKYKLPRHVDAINSALGTSLRRQTEGSQPWLGRLGPTMQHTQHVSLRRQTTKTAVGLGVCSNLCTHNKSDFSA